MQIHVFIMPKKKKKKKALYLQTIFITINLRNYTTGPNGVQMDHLQNSLGLQHLRVLDEKVSKGSAEQCSLPQQHLFPWSLLHSQKHSNNTDSDDPILLVQISQERGNEGMHPNLF